MQQEVVDMRLSMNLGITGSDRKANRARKYEKKRTETQRKR